MWERVVGRHPVRGFFGTVKNYTMRRFGLFLRADPQFIPEGNRVPPPCLVVLLPGKSLQIKPSLVAVEQGGLVRVVFPW